MEPTTQRSHVHPAHVSRRRFTLTITLILLAIISGPIGGNATVTAATLAQAATCPALQVLPGARIDGFLSDQYRWFDSGCQPRSAALVRNNAQDPAGRWGGYMRQYTYQVNGATRTANGSSSRHPGFGYTTNHYGPNGGSAWLSFSGKGTSYRTLLYGSNHAIHEYKMRLPLGAPVDATVHWFFATGRDHPIWSVTFDSRPAGPNVVRADTRAPYGNIQWDGGANAPVAGVGWGDHYKFKTTSTSLNFSSTWDYSVRNTVPYAMEWAKAVDAEMGLVQTQTSAQHDAGGYWGYPLWGKTSSSPDLPADTLAPGGMPRDYNWPYQLNQYEIPYQNPLTSKRLAWGSNFGAVGQTSYPALGDASSRSGYPFQSYSVFVAMGKQSTATVAAQVREIETVQRTALVARAGTVATTGPAGIARTDNVAYRPAGYNHIYSTWELIANSQNAVDFDMKIAAGGLRNPIFVIRNYTATTAPAQITVNGVVKRSGVDFFPSVDAASKKLWLTFKGTLSGTTSIRIGSTPPTPVVTLPVYSDAPAAGWEDWSWGGVNRNLASVNPVRTGTASIGVTYTGAWSGFKFGRVDPVDISTYDTLRFWVHGGTSGNQNVRVHIVNDAGQIEQTITPIAGIWTQVDMPLAGLATKNVTAIEWFNNTAGTQPTFYLDDVAFVDNTP